MWQCTLSTSTEQDRMQRLCGAVFILWCMLTGLEVKAQQNAKTGKTAIIAATIDNPASDDPVSTTYFFGIYGKSSLFNPVTGRLVHVRSEGGNHGCEDYNHDLPTDNWVALIERGECYFTDKIRVATKQYNASAVLIYDDGPTRDLVLIHSQVDDEVYLFIKQSVGRRMADLVDSGSQVQINITSTDKTPSAATAVMSQTVTLCVAVISWVAYLLV